MTESNGTTIRQPHPPDRNVRTAMHWASDGTGSDTIAGTDIGQLARTASSSLHQSQEAQGIGQTIAPDDVRAYGCPGPVMPHEFEEALLLPDVGLGYRGEAAPQRAVGMDAIRSPVPLQQNDTSYIVGRRTAYGQDGIDEQFATEHSPLTGDGRPFGMADARDEDGRIDHRLLHGQKAKGRIRQMLPQHIQQTFGKRTMSPP